jgi:lysophospholipase L1-like esterase
LNNLLLATALCLIVSSGCTEDETTVTQPPGPPNTGSADFTRYVAVGNSVTAGYQSYALSQRDQPQSFTNLLAGQVQTGFELPLIKDPGIGGRIRLLSLSPLTLVQEQSVAPIASSNLNIALARPYNNLGIAGAILYDIMDTTDASANFVNKSAARGNPFFALVLRNSALGRSIFQQARNLAPTFITCWIGNNDVLGYATSGGLSGSNAGLFAPPRTLPTEAVLFGVWYSQLLDSLQSIPSVTGIVTANIPNIPSLPFFTTLGPQIHAKLLPGIPLRYQRNGNKGPASDTTTLAGSPADPYILLTGYAYAPLLGRPGGKWYRDLAASRGVPVDSVMAPLMALGIDTTKPFGFHPQNPWPDALTLDDGERAIADNAITSFNATIGGAASARGIPVVDVAALFNQALAKQIYYPELGTFSSDFITGGTFSYDGIHPSSRGQAMIANEFIKIINSQFSAQIPFVSVPAVPGMPIGKTSLQADRPVSYDRWKNFLEVMGGLPASGHSN